MTRVAVRTDLVLSIYAACGLAGVRVPNTVEVAALEWDPDLSPGEQVTIDSLVRLAVGSMLVTPAERTAIEPSLASLRTFQQLSQADFIALAQNARDRQLFDTTTALIRVIRVFLRD